MQQWIVKFKRTVTNGKTVTKKQEIVLCEAVNYTDVEILIAKFVEKENFMHPTPPDIAKLQAHELLGVRVDQDGISDMNWWKARIKCTSEDDKGKISIFYVRYLVNSENLDKALDLVKKKEQSQPVQGEIESVMMTKLDYMLIPTKE